MTNLSTEKINKEIKRQQEDYNKLQNILKTSTDKIDRILLDHRLSKLRSLCLVLSKLERISEDMIKIEKEFKRCKSSL